MSTLNLIECHFSISYQLKHLQNDKLCFSSNNFMMDKKLLIFGTIGGIGVLLIIVSMAGFAYFPPIIESQVFENLDLTNTESEGYKNFVSTCKQLVIFNAKNDFFIAYIDVISRIMPLQF